MATTPSSIVPETADHTLTLPWVRTATRGFVYAEEMRQAVSLALAAGLNLIFSGPGGHAKSEFLEAVFSAVDDTEPHYVKSFGQGTSTEELYGGLDFDALNRQEGATIQFNPELSFLPHHIAVFEELFDAPPRVLTSLKDTLTAKKLRNGHQRFEMATRVIAAATNHSPQRIAEGGPEIAALIERFPIQLEVKWDEYSEDTFADLFTAVTSGAMADTGQTTPWTDVEAMQQRAAAVKISSGLQRMLARIIVELRKDKVTISPRTAVVAIKLAQAAAAINGRDRVIPQDVVAIAFLPGAHARKARISQLIIEYSEGLQAEEALDTMREDLREVRQLEQQATTEDDLSTALSLAEEIHREANHLRHSSEQFTRRQQIIDQAAEVIEQLSMRLTGMRAERSVGTNTDRLAEIGKRLIQLDRSLERSDAEGRRAARAEVSGLHDELIAMDVNDALKSRHDAVMSQFRVVQIRHLSNNNVR